MIRLVFRRQIIEVIQNVHNSFIFFCSLLASFSWILHSLDQLLAKIHFEFVDRSDNGEDGFLPVDEYCLIARLIVSLQLLVASKSPFMNAE